MKKNKEKDEPSYPLENNFEKNKTSLKCPVCGQGQLNKIMPCSSYTRNQLNPHDPPFDTTWVIECRACQTSHMRLVIGQRGEEGDYYIGYEVSQIPI